MRRDECTDQERWVLEQLEQGKIADLNKKFGEEEENRCLRADFLAALLTDEIEGFKPKRQRIQIFKAVIPEATELQNAEVAHSVSFDACIFEEAVSFRDTRFQRHLFLNYCRFSKKADFHRLQVELNLFCLNATFQGQVNFGSANIGGQFNATWARFQGQGPNNDANFNGIKVGQAAFFDKSVFQGPVDLRAATIGIQFSATEAQFQGQGPENQANFNSIKVGQAAFFDKSVFQGPVDFAGANIKGQFVANEAKFLAQEQEANFSGIQVNQEAFFYDTLFQGGIQMADAIFLDLLFEGIRFCPLFSMLRLERTVVRRTLNISDVGVKELEAAHMQCKGPTVIANVHIKESADLRDGHLQHLKLVKIKWPGEKNAVFLDGLTYHSISTKENLEDHENWPELLNLLEISRFNTQNYKQLDEYLERGGQKYYADKVHSARKWRDLIHNIRNTPNRSLRILKYGLKVPFVVLLWDWLAGYGRKPGRVWWVVIPAVLLGTALFCPQFDAKYFEKTTYIKEILQAHPFLTRFLLSLDRFLPGVDVGLAKHWQPISLGFYTWLYWYILKLLGWITIPVALAAIYSKIK